MSLATQPALAQRAQLVCCVMVAAMLTGACMKRLPLRPPPEQSAPAVDTSAPIAEGHGRIVVDVVDGPTAVKRATIEPIERTDASGATRFELVERFEPLCQSPCVADLPFGNTLLAFPVDGNPRSLEVELVHIGPQPTVYRRALSNFTQPKRGARFVIGVIAVSLGASAVITGAALLPVGFSKDNDNLKIAGGITLGAGAASLALGGYLIKLDSSRYRPGSATHFALP